ncbi:MAG TPA: hypothetical protein VEY33_04945 [Gemmatimonadota bacterium]|nr:hypothetical protein [Gemmatimonadota bacterium]
MRSWSQPHLPALVVICALACGRAAPSGGLRTAEAPGSDAALIRNATSAAPEAVAREATVIAVGERGQMRTLRQGSGEFTCFPDDPAAPGNVPMCFDRAGLAWAQAWMTKQTPPADLPIGVAYMLQGSWTQSNADPHAAPAPDTPGVTTGPALMILNTRGMLRGHLRDASNPARPFVMWPDTPYEHLMVPVAVRTR